MMILLFAKTTGLNKLLNEEGDKIIVLGDLEHSESRRDFGYYSDIKFKEVEVIRKMRRGRTIEPDEILVEFWKISVMQVWSSWPSCLTSFLGHQKCPKNGGGV